MKKVLAMLIALTMILCMVSCAGTPDTQTETEKITETNAPATETPETEEPETEVPVTEEPETEAPETTENSYDWRQFLKDYEAWVDDYITFMDKYNANPTDLTLLSDYSKMMTEYAEWSTKVDEMDDDLSDSEAIEYATELSRIAAKLADAAY